MRLLKCSRSKMYGYNYVWHENLILLFGGFCIFREIISEPFVNMGGEESQKDAGNL